MSDLLYRLGQRALGTLPRVEPLMRPGRDQTSVASQHADAFGESETFREADAASSHAATHASPQESREVSPTARPVAAPTLSGVIDQIFRDEPEPTYNARQTEPSQSAAPPAHRSADTEAAVNDSIPRNILKETAEGLLPGGVTSVRPDLPAQTDRTSLRMPGTVPRLSTIPTDIVQSSVNRTEVEVSIGRIEVHTATAPSPAPPAPSRKVPVLSLDEYLAKRRGERA